MIVLKRALKVTLTFCLFLGFTYPTQINAENTTDSKGKLNINVESTTNSIEISWDSLADHYEVRSVKKTKKDLGRESYKLYRF
ncbi:hypothetical protein CEN49_22065 [Fischerella thermalis CCMEE 5273]|nr:hypothetical protein CEN49_22065 [Fischerella thermalis CCMEE 5273]